MGKIGNVSMPGITAERDLRGNIKSLNINVKKCSEAVRNFFESYGIVFEKTNYDPKFVSKIRATEKEKGTHIKAEDIWN